MRKASFFLSTRRRRTSCWRDWSSGGCSSDLTLAMIFEKASTRTRVSFEAGMYQMGGSVLNLTTTDSQLGREIGRASGRERARYREHGLRDKSAGIADARPHAHKPARAAHAPA